MSIYQFTAFYPSRPCWVGNKVNLEDQSHKDQMKEEVFSFESDSYTLKVCRDGRIMIRVESLEENGSSDNFLDLDKEVKIWGEYLNYLNTFYLLLDSSTIEIMKLGHFNLDEITSKDAFRVRYEEGKSIGENIAFESITSAFQNDRILPGHLIDSPFSNMTMRQVISIKVIERTSELFAHAVNSPGLVKKMASYAKSLSEYKVGNYETSVVLAWFVTEAIISRIWEKHIDSLNVEFSEGGKRINSARHKFLTSSNFSISIISNLLELWDLLPNEKLQDIDAVRGYRNKIVHPNDFRPSSNEVRLALKTAQWMIETKWAFKFTPSLGYSVPPLLLRGQIAT